MVSSIEMVRSCTAYQKAYRIRILGFNLTRTQIELLAAVRLVNDKNHAIAKR
jgi:hypothetical protein